MHLIPPRLVNSNSVNVKLFSDIHSSHAQYIREMMRRMMNNSYSTDAHSFTFNFSCWVLILNLNENGLGPELDNQFKIMINEFRIRCRRSNLNSSLYMVGNGNEAYCDKIISLTSCWWHIWCGGWMEANWREVRPEEIRSWMVTLVSSNPRNWKLNTLKNIKNIFKNFYIYT